MESDLVKAAVRARRPGRRRMAHENRVLLFALASGLAGVIPALVLLWSGDYSGSTQWTLSVLIVSCWLAFAFTVRGAVVRPLQTLANMQAALREGDFSMRARVGNPEDALGELMREVNALSEMLREQRLGAMEASALLGTVMAEIDVAVFTFDPQARLRLVNRAGERLLSQNLERLLGRTAEELGLADCLQGEMARTVEKSFPARAGRWGMRRTVFRQGGAPHQLLVISDLSRALREEERQAWQRLVRVLGHEMNNSLAPISSIAQSLETLLKREPRSADWEDDLRRGLKIIAERSDALSKFMRDYSRLARLPKPQLQQVELGALVRAAARVETRLPVEVVPGPEISLQADPDQLQQALINLIRNAADASLETRGKVSVGWHRNGASLAVVVRDEGLGIANPGNLFVPFFTTKPGGSGIGLALSRQIAEAHGGTVQLSNREEGKGCEARLHLPL
jgi:nitrogen fixation/metabolism regulation signal transduction histidine kinase